MIKDLSVAAYAGSKNHTADKYMHMIPYDGINVYAEPFGGMFGVGMKKAPHQTEIYNDLNTKLSLLFKTLSDQENGVLLLDMLCTAEYSERFFEYAKDASNFLCKYTDGIFDNDNDAVFVSCLIYSTLLMSYNGQMKQFKGVSTGHEEEAFYKQIKKKLSVIERLKNVHVLNADGVEIIKACKDKEDAFLFIDPPYTKKNDSSKKNRDSIYEIELLSDEQQQNLLDALKDAKAKILVCSYRNELYDKTLCDKYGFKCVDVAETCKSMSIGRRGCKKSRAVEVAYINYDIRKCH